MHVSQAGVSNYIPQFTVGVIAYPCLRYRLLAPKSSYMTTHDDVMAEKQLPHYQRFLGERTVTARFAYQKASNGQLWCFFFVSPNMLLNKQWSCRWFETPRCSCDATAMSGTSVVPVKMCESKQFTKKHMQMTLYTAGHLHTAVPHCSHSRAPGEQWARLYVFTLQGCVQAARLCRGSPVICH